MWLWKPGFPRPMINSTNSLVRFKLHHSLGMDRLLNKDLTMNSNFQANELLCHINYNFVDNLLNDMI